MKKLLSLILCFNFIILLCSGCSNEVNFDPNDPITLSIWHVYGSQTESPLNDMITQFNEEVGSKKGIIVNVISVMNSNTIDDALLAASNGEPSIPELPDLFTAYPRIVEKIGANNLLDFSQYFSEEELNGYRQEFLSEGYIDNQLLMLPIAKSTEVIFLNKTLYDRFAAATNHDISSLSTMESLFATSNDYYDYTNGMAMFQYNDLYYYFLVNINSLKGTFVKDGKIDVFSPQFEKVFTELASAAIYGGVCVGEGFGSDRWKTAEIICNISSTAGMLYLRDYVTYEDNTTENIEFSILPYPLFNGGDNRVVQRGVGLFAMKNEDERKNEAATIFAKWLCEKQNNFNFTTKSGYLPVTHEAFDYLFENINQIENTKYKQLYTSIDEMYKQQYQFTSIPLFEGADDLQDQFQNSLKATLSDAHDEYVKRCANNEDKDTLLNELVQRCLKETQNTFK